mmetsp:Transcript_7973/g.13232  ORF Transcript_7973/g.13232 Transcript_7973/m.13232 type:complete len:534 (-) Transcript_7973:135-1736(-)
MGKTNKRDREYEDPEERALRKEAKKAEKMARSLGYSNEVNPFGDSNLMQPFVWGKKKEKEKYEGSSSTGSSDKRRNGDEERKRTELISEIEKVRKRRKDREAEVEEMQRLRDEEQRLRESAQYDDWQRKEEEFILNQTQQRSKIRLVENREKPIDIIAKNILLVEAAVKTREVESSSSSSSSTAADRKDVHLLELEGELRNPIEVIQELNKEDMRHLRKDVDAYLQLETSKSGKYQQFWESLLTVVTIELQKLKSETATSVHQSISADVKDLLKGKTVTELDNLERDIEKSLREGKGGDVEYWELMKAEVALQRAKAHVQSTHVELLTQQLQLLGEIREEQKKSGTTAAATAAAASSTSSDHNGGNAPASDIEAIFDNEDREEKMQSNAEIALTGKSYAWDDKYRPRKPRYFNRVRTGFFRTKYNLSHYDRDNPPPKMIQGYKFTIFYPDLIDKTKTPKYFIEPCVEEDSQGNQITNNDFAIIRFHAGPPYEDVAFKVINKEWETNRRYGFLCVFDRGVLQLNFSFRHSFYRR